MNWGKGLMLGMGAFMLFIIVLVVKMFNQPVDAYDKEYYEKGLAYDTVYNKEKQVITDNATPLVNVIDSNLSIKFTTSAQVKLKFTRPSDRKMDRTLNLNTNSSNTIDIPLAQLASGQWQIAIDWVSNNKTYFYKQEITVP